MEGKPRSFWEGFFSAFDLRSGGSSIRHKDNNHIVVEMGGRIYSIDLDDTAGRELDSQALASDWNSVVSDFTTAVRIGACKFGTIPPRDSASLASIKPDSPRRTSSSSAK